VLRSRRAVASAWTAAVVTSSLAAAADARATEPAAPTRSTRSGDFLLWQAPPGCSSAAALHERVRELVGETELDLKRVQRVEGRVSESQGGWTLHLRLVDALGPRERELRAEHCTDLAEAAAVAITLAFEAARSREAELAKGAGTSGAASDDAASDEAAGNHAADDDAADDDAASEPASPPDPPAPADAAPVDEHPAETGPRYGLGVELVVDVGTLPVTAPGVSLFGALRWSELQLAIYALWLPGADKAVAPEQSVEFSLASGGVTAGYALGHGWVDTVVCAGIEAGSVSARGAGLVNSRSVHDLWLAPHAGLELSAHPGGGFAVFVRGEAVIPLLRQSYAVNDIVAGSASVDTIASVGARLAGGALIAF
jgi:hypothetical protein